MIYLVKKKIKSLSNDNNLIKSFYLKLNRVKVGALSFLSDDVFSKIKYYENTGMKLNLERPTTFNEKLWWLKINYRTSLMTQCSDKVLVHDYLNGLELGHLSNKIIGVYERAEDVPFDKLNGKYFIKCNHVSGTNAIYDSKLNFNKEDFNKKFNLALSNNYFYQSREWNYKNIKPRIIVEEYIHSETPLLDYRFFCFDGKVKLIFVDIETASEDGSHNPSAKRNIYDDRFNLQSFSVGREGFEPSLVKKPENLELMLDYAEKIARPFPFCRVDLYNVDGVIKFGEITFYPGGATQQFSCKEKDLEVASWITAV